MKFPMLPEKVTINVGWFIVAAVILVPIVAILIHLSRHYCG